MMVSGEERGMQCFIHLSGIYKYTRNWMDDMRHGQGNASTLMALCMMVTGKVMVGSPLQRQYLQEIGSVHASVLFRMCV